MLVADLIAKIATSEVPPGGHNMGFHDALATMHYRTGLVVKDWKAGGCSTLPTNYYGVATLEDGVAGMRFLDALGRSITGGNVPVDVN